SPGMNFIEGSLEPGAPPVFRSGELAVSLENYVFEPGRRLAGRATLGVRPEHVSLAGAGSGMPFSRQVEIEIVEPMGSETLVWTRLGAAAFAFLVDSETRIAAGDRVTIGFDPARASLFDAAGGGRL
ncbi:MAG: ATPase component of ABC-type sugar transporter, partial [Rhizobiaceae bacterium]|nr:ATPase component of ABC-type sugar transporter [Rhizobiaceae bacterium]